MNVFELSRKRPWFTENPGISNPPVGMLGHHESLLCYYLARHAFTGRGAIVDAGSFLGKSAFFMAQGLRANPSYIAGVHRISCFDNFLVNEGATVAFIQNYLGHTLSVGDSTRSIFDSQVAQVKDMLDVNSGDFHVASWPGRPIEILMVDIAKSEELGKRVAEIFFPNLIPGTSIVIHQDYHHPWLPHIHVVMEYLADYFEIIAPRVDDSAVFLHRKAIPCDILRRAIDYDFTYQERLRLMDGAISRLSPEDRFYVQLARIVLQNGNEDEAVLRRELDDLETRFHQGNHGYSGNAYFENVRQTIDEREGWRQNRERNHARALELADGMLKRWRSGSVLALRGSALLALGRPMEAERDLRAALRFRPPSGYTYVDLARSLHCQERYDEAEAELLRGVADRDALDATSRDYLHMLGTVLVERNDPSKDAPTLARLRSELPDDPELSALEARLTPDRPSEARQAWPQPVIEPRQAPPAEITPADAPGRVVETNPAGASRIDPDNEEYRARMRQALEEHYFTEVLDGYLDSAEGKASLFDHVAGRYQIAANYVVPWLRRKFDLSGKTIIEVGSGTGSSTLALAQAAKSLECYELHEHSTAVARERLGFWGVTNVRFHSELFDEECEFVRNGGTADAVMLYAALEHMTHDECLKILALSWRVLRQDGILVVAETPNRLSMIDEHTSRLPFFSQLPREIQLRYADRSPREDFRWAIAQAGQHGHDSALEAITRWGSGISFHEFELAIGPGVHNCIVLDGYEPEIASVVAVSPIDRTLQRVFEQFDVQAHRAFTRRILYLVAQKRPVNLDSLVRKPESTESDSAARDNSRPWDQVSVPAAVDIIPSMLTKDEKQYLIWLTSEKFEGWGAIVELGTWLGSSSAALAEGLRRRSRDTKIHSFDWFRWDSHMSDKAGPLLEVGEDFLPLFLKETAPYAPWIEAKKVDLMNVSWEGGPIELVFVDSAKTWDLTNAVLKTFGPHLVPGRSRIVLQDFRYPYSYCQPLIFDSRPDVWKQVEDMQYGSTVTFMPLKPLFGPSGIDPSYSEESFPIASADHLLRSRIAREEPENRYLILQSLYRKYLIDGKVDGMLKLREEVCAGGVDEANLKLMENVGDVLNRRGWKALMQGDFQTARAIAERWLSVAREPSVYAFALLGFVLLRQGEGEGVKQAIERIRAISPDFLPGKMLRVELAISEGRYAEAEAEAREVLDSKPDEVTSQWSRNLLLQAEAGRRKGERLLNRLFGKD